jgi:pilus assembly protein Flp/PilA
MNGFTRRFIADESGATLIEYGMIVGLIALVIAAGVSSIGTSLRAHFNDVVNGFGQ